MPLNNSPIIITSDEAKAMNFSAEFDSYARSIGIRNPFTVSRKLFAKRCRSRKDGGLIVDIDFDENGHVKGDPDEPSKEEKAKYIYMRDKYVARRCFYEIGYESFIAHTKFDTYSKYNVTYLRDKEAFVPCKSADKQCNLFCPKFAACALQGAWKPE